MMHEIRLILIVWLVVIASPLVASPLDGELPPINAFNSGIGLAGVAVPDNPSFVYWNPAGLAFLSQRSIDFTAAAPKAETPGSWSFLIANKEYGGNSNFAFGIIRRQVRLEDQTDRIDYRSFEVIAPMSFKLGMKDTPVGISLKFISERVRDGEWKYGAACDVGVMQRLGSELYIGFAVRNLIGSHLRSFGSESWLGGSLGGDDDPILIACQVRMDRPFDRNYMSRNYGYGARFRLRDDLPELRTGYLRRDDSGWITAGLGYRTETYTRIEYTLLVQVDDSRDATHFLTYGYSLDPDPLLRAMERLGK
ncbi:MAG: hypothetical protein P9M15_03325 [Candidatus Electryoneaceae bacterium]|nr:hypothetical protein [Candidatus Electryoneaceae bacterium]